MSNTRICTRCSCLTMMSHCPKCEAGTKQYLSQQPSLLHINDADLVETPRETRLNPSRSFKTANNVVESDQPHKLLEEKLAAVTRDRDALRKDLQLVEKDNGEMRKKLANQKAGATPSPTSDELLSDKKQMLQSAQDIRELHANNRSAREKDLQRIADLEAENALLRDQARDPGFASFEDDGIHKGAYTNVADANDEIERLRRLLRQKTQHIAAINDRAARAGYAVRDVMDNLDAAERVSEEVASCSSMQAITERSRSPMTKYFDEIQRRKEFGNREGRKSNSPHDSVNSRQVR